MPSFRDTILRLYRQLVDASGEPTTLAAGGALFLDGSSAVAVCEAAITGIATTCGGSGSPFSTTSEVAWRSEQARLGRTLLGDRLQNLGSAGPRGAMAAAMGLSLAGERTTLFISGADLGAMPDLLTAAVERHLPLVIHMTTRDQKHTLSGGDEAIALAIQSGATTLMAESVQQAVDFTLIARRVAERSLTPVVVVIDSQQTAASGQRVILPTLELVDQFVGRDGDEVVVTDSSQQIVFGETRRRVPRWHDLDRPTLHGALHNSETMGLLAASRQQFFGHNIALILDEAMSEFKRLCGRNHCSLTSHAAAKAEYLVIAEGSAIQQARAVTSELKKLKVGVVGLYARLPINRAEIIKLVAGKHHIVLLEQQSRSTRHSPLFNEIRALLDLAHAANPTSSPIKLTSAIYGLGGAPLLNRDLAQLIKALANGELAGRLSEKCYLGLSLTQSNSRHPKRQVLLDSLQREFPQLAKLGLKGDSVYRAKGSAATITVALYRGTHPADGQLINEIGSLIQQCGTSAESAICLTVESYPELKWQAWGNQLTDRLHFRESAAKKGAAPIEADAESPVDLAIVTEQQGLHSALKQLSDRAVMLISPDITLSDELARQYSHIDIYRVASAQADGEEMCAERELLMGAIFGLLTQKEWLDANLRPILTAREAHFVSVTTAEIDCYRDAFKQGFEQLNPAEPESLTEEVEYKPTIPLAVRHLSGREGSKQQYASLPRFWDQVGLPYQNGERDEQGADPFLATNSVPPLTSTFNSYSRFNLQLPLFDEGSCSACGECWVSCPDSAIAVSAFTPTQFIERAITAADGGALRPLATKISARMTTLAREWQSEEPSERAACSLTIGQLLTSATEWVCEKGAIDGDRLDSITAAARQVTVQLGGIQVAVTEALFHAAESSQKGGGTLLALAINPDACKGCGLCIDRCPESALVSSTSIAAKVSSQTQWQIWEQLPDTDSTTIERVSGTAMNPIAARMLSRYCAFPMAGGDSAEPASGAKIALRMALTTLEYHQQPLIARFNERVGDIHQQVNHQIRELLSDTLAIDSLASRELSQLSESLSNLENRLIDLGQLNTVLEQVHDNSQIDATRLTRLLEIAKALGDLHWKLTEGEQGLGRARYSLVVAPGHHNSWTATYPYNPFQVPAQVENGGDAPQVAAGLIAAQVRRTNDAIGLLRWAEIELKNVASKADEQMDIPAWADLDDDERAISPPLVLFGEAQEFGGHALSQLLWLLKSELPVKVIVVSDLDFGLDSYGYHGVDIASTHQASQDLAMVALFQSHAYVAQSAISAPEHLQRVMSEALKYSGPALIQIHAPSPEHHGFATSDTLLQAQRAVDARANPLFSANPLAEGVFGRRISLEGNRDITQPWVGADDSESHLNGDLSRWGEWAVNEARFSHWFKPLGADDTTVIPLDDYLGLGAEARAKKSASVSVDNEQYRVALDMVEVIEACHNRWRTLQELAGIVTPFTDEVRARAEADIATQHQAELDQLRQRYEQQIAEIQQNFKNETAQKLRESLMNIAGYNPDVVNRDSQG